MESGQRKDNAGKVVPRKIIKQFVAAFNGKTVFEADWNPAISANPYQSFFYKAAETGEFTSSLEGRRWIGLCGEKNKLTVELIFVPSSKVTFLKRRGHEADR